MNSFVLWATLGLMPWVAVLDGGQNVGCPICDCCGCCDTGGCTCDVCTCKCCVAGCSAVDGAAEQKNCCRSGCGCQERLTERQ